MASVRPHLLALDSDDDALQAIARLAGPYYNVLTTRDLRRLVAWMEHYPDVAVVVTEHVLAAGTGVAVLDTARTLHPHARRVLLTTYHDLASIVEGVHSGAIQVLVQKPFAPGELLAAIAPQAVAAAARKASA